MLLRLVAVLFSMADLAERAAGAPRPVRCLVLWALFRADWVVKEFILDTASAEGRLWVPALVSVRHGFEPADALVLAASLRTLAFVLEGMAAPLFGPSGHGRLFRIPSGGRHASPPLPLIGTIVSAPAAPRLDTS
jgi:hypothetical protein